VDKADILSVSQGTSHRWKAYISIFADPDAITLLSAELRIFERRRSLKA